MKIFVVWTPEKIAEFVTESAIKDGGKVINELKKECEAVSLARRLNTETTEGAGHYCVMIKDN